MVSIAKIPGLQPRPIFDDRPLPMPLSHRPSDDSRLTLGPQGGLGKGMVVRERPLISSESNRQMNMGPVSGYGSTNPVQILFDEQDKSLSRIHVAEKPLHEKPGKNFQLQFLQQRTQKILCSRDA